MSRSAVLCARLRAIGDLHEHPAVVEWWTRRVAPLVAILDPTRRRWLLAAAAVVVGVRRVLARAATTGARATGMPWLAWVDVLIVFGLLVLCYLAAVHVRRLPDAVRRRPQVALHLLFWVIVAVTWLLPAGGGRRVLVPVAGTLTVLLWRMGYVLLSGQRGKAAKTRFADHLFYLWPVWGGTNTPYGKGFDYLSRCEAQSAEPFARSQLAGLKLLLLGLVWKMAVEVMGAVVYGSPGSTLTPLLHGYTLGVPRLPHLMRHAHHVPLLTAWVSLYLELIWATLRLAAKGHVIIGYLRLCGFNVFRNTYKPLLAETIVEFWNRYYYYFKELLVEFFFFPTFARHFRQRPHLRMLAAVFAAAFAGNLYYHMIEQPAFLAGNFRAVWAILHARVFYCLLLAIGIGASMLREQRRRGGGTVRPPGGVRRVARITVVWTFFSLIHIWGVPGASPSFAHRTRFFFSLFGL